MKTSPSSHAMRAGASLVVAFGAYVLWDAYDGFRHEVSKDAAGLFEQQECRTGRMASDTAAYLAASTPDERDRYREEIGRTGVWCRVQGNEDDGYRLRVEGRRVLPFAIESPVTLENREWCRQQRKEAEAGQPEARYWRGVLPGGAEWTSYPEAHR